MILSENRYPPPDQVRGQAFSGSCSIWSEPPIRRIGPAKAAVAGATAVVVAVPIASTMVMVIVGVTGLAVGVAVLPACLPGRALAVVGEIAVVTPRPVVAP